MKKVLVLLVAILISTSLYGRDDKISVTKIMDISTTISAASGTASSAYGWSHYFSDPVSINCDTFQLVIEYTVGSDTLTGKPLAYSGNGFGSYDSLGIAIYAEAIGPGNFLNSKIIWGLQGANVLTRIDTLLEKVPADTTQSNLSFGLNIPRSSLVKASPFYRFAIYLWWPQQKSKGVVKAKVYMIRRWV